MLENRSRVKNVMCFAILTGLALCVTSIAQNQQDKSYEEAVDLFSVGNSLVESFLDRSAATQNALREAINRYNRAIRLYPNFKEAHYNKGLCIMYYGSRGERRYNNASACFEKVLQINPEFIDAEYANAYASYYIKAGSKAQGSNPWNSAVSLSISMLNKIISNHPGTTVAENARKMLVYIEWARKYGFKYSLYGRAKKPKPFEPVPEILQVAEDLQRKQAIKTAITETRKGVVSDESHEFKFIIGRPVNPYIYSGKVYNKAGLALHNFSVQIQSYDGYPDNTFKSLYVMFDYNGRPVAKGVVPLPNNARGMARLAMKGKLIKTPSRVVDSKGIRIGLVFEDVEVYPSGPNRYKGITARIIIDITE